MAIKLNPEHRPILDRIVFAAVNTGKRTAREVLATAVADFPQTAGVRYESRKWAEQCLYRPVDGALQRLRRSGKIRWDAQARGWSAA